METSIDSGATAMGVKVGLMFATLDEVRRQAGRWLAATGCGPNEAPSRVVAAYDAARLRAYQDRSADTGGPVLLLIPAPIKRHYIWDLMPGTSVVRRCRENGVRVYLIEWLLPRANQDDLGLDDYADRLIDEACRAVEADTAGARPILAGHSLGGTFAAIYASLYPSRVRGIALLDAPLSFGEAGDRLASAVAASPHASSLRLAFGSPVPGSAITLLSVAGAPDIFIGQPRVDRLACCSDSQGSAIHCRVMRWILDELPMPGRLFEETLELLYRRNSFLRGTLRIGKRRAAVDGLRCPLLAVVNSAGGVVPPAAIYTALRRVPLLPTRILAYEADRGPALQHVGPLVARAAHEQLWPHIIRWVHELAAQP